MVAAYCCGYGLLPLGSSASPHRATGGGGGGEWPGRAVTPRRLATAAAAGRSAARPMSGAGAGSGVAPPVLRLAGGAGQPTASGAARVEKARAEQGGRSSPPLQRSWGQDDFKGAWEGFLTLGDYGYGQRREGALVWGGCRPPAHCVFLERSRLGCGSRRSRQRCWLRSCVLLSAAFPRAALSSAARLRARGGKGSEPPGQMLLVSP